MVVGACEARKESMSVWNDIITVLVGVCDSNVVHSKTVDLVAKFCAELEK